MMSRLALDLRHAAPAADQGARAGSDLQEELRKVDRNRLARPATQPGVTDGAGPLPIAAVLARGLLAGLVGTAAMTVAEKVEQAVTGRPNSHVPAHGLERLPGRTARPDRERLWMDWAMHWGQGMALGAVRALLADRGIRGPAGSFVLLNLRLLSDQALEGAAGVGAPPGTWSDSERAVELLHKAVYAFATGAVADALVPGRSSSVP
jgi:hypothetical protein